MSPTSAPNRSHRRLLFLTVAFFGLIGVLLLVLGGDPLRGFERKVARLREQGEPTRPDEMRQWSSEPPVEAAALSKLNTALGLMADRWCQLRPEVRGDPPTLRTFVEPFDEVCRLAADTNLIRYVTRVPNGSDGVPQTEVLKLGGPVSVSLRVLATVEIGCAQARERLRAGDVTGAVDALVCAIRFAHLPEASNGQMLGIVGIGLPVQVVGDLVRSGRLGDRELERLDGALREWELSDSVRDELVGARTMSITMYRQVASVSHDPPRANADVVERVGRAMYRLRFRAGLRIGQLDKAACLALDLFELQFEELGMDGNPQGLRQVSERRAALLSRSTGRNRFFLGSYPEVVRNARIKRSNCRLGRLAVAIARHRLAESGRFPGSLEDLVPRWLERVPMDPETGRVLGYSRGADRSWQVTAEPRPAPRGTVQAIRSLDFPDAP